MSNRTLRRMSLGGLLVASCMVAGCVRTSNGTWYVHSADMPADWPELTPVGEVEVKAYPAYRAAQVSDFGTPDGAGPGTRPMFMELFRHIKENDIAMTAPVDMGYAGDDHDPRMTSMAFLYARADLGSPGSDGSVVVADHVPRTFASVGVRGPYSMNNYRKGRAAIDAWLEGNPRWRPAGASRYLGYNSPFVPSFARYGEVQVPVVDSVEAR